MSDLSSNNSTTRRAIFNTVSNYLGQFVWLITWFFLTPFILQILGDADYGLWVLVGSVVAYGTLFDFGIAEAVTKYVAEYRKKGEIKTARRLVATALSLYTIIGAAVMVSGVAIAPFFPSLFNISTEQTDLAVWMMSLAALYIGITIPCATSFAVLRGLQRFDLLNLIKTGGTIVQAILTVVVLWLGAGAIGLFVVAIIIQLAMQVPSIWYVHRLEPDLKFGWTGAHWSSMRTVASFSWAIFLGNAGGHLETKTDEIVIGVFLPISVIAPFSICRKLSQLPLTMTEQFLKLLLPIASELNAINDFKRLQKLYITSSRLTVAVFLPIGVTLAMLAQPLLGVWVGEAYAEYTYLVYILVLASLLDTILWPAGLVLQGMSYHKIPALMTVCTGISNLIISVALVSRYGLAGVALGTLIPTTIVTFGFMLPYTMHVTQIKASTLVREVFWPTVLPVLPLILSVILLREIIRPTNLFVIGVIGGIGILAYLVSYLSFNADSLEKRLFQDATNSSLRFAKRHFPIKG